MTQQNVAWILIQYVNIFFSHENQKTFKTETQ